MNTGEVIIIQQDRGAGDLGGGSPAPTPPPQSSTFDTTFDSTFS